MRRRFTKMHGAGNDFVVLDATREAFDLDAPSIRRLADRRLGVGADQVLVVEPARGGVADFHYRIFNGASGREVGQCGNGARCVGRFVRDRGLSSKARLNVETAAGALALFIEPGGAVSVDMGAPVFEPHRVPFDASGLVPREHDGLALWPLEIEGRRIEIAALSMGNPHAVLLVDDVDSAAVESLGPAIESHPRFPSKTNVGFAQIVSRTRLRLRVFERDAGETPACGSGACAAVVAGIRLGRLDDRVEVETRGGTLAIAWSGAAHGVLMSGPVETVFEGEIDL